MAVFVLDKRKRPLMPCSEKRARQMLERGRAVVHRMYPFTIRLKDRIGGVTQPIEVRLDPGSKTTGIAVVRVSDSVDTATGEMEKTSHVLWLAELTHRGARITKALLQRSQRRRRRRSANLRYRAKRFQNRRRPAGWLAPSLMHRVLTTTTWVRRLMGYAPVSSIAVEHVRFDTQALRNPEISGVEYQQGTLFGYEVREYLLEKHGRRCAYCDATNVPLQIEHIDPRARGGSDRISNLTLACGPCNTAKGAQPVAEFLRHDPARLARIRANSARPLRDASAVNATRWKLIETLEDLGPPVTRWTGGRTKFNRQRLGISKTHALDAACVGDCGSVVGWQRPVLAIACSGRGLRQKALSDRFGFARGHRQRTRTAFGFRSGDMVNANPPKGKHAGSHRGAVSVRATGSFAIDTAAGRVDGINRKYCRLIERSDGYKYAQTTNHS